MCLLSSDQSGDWISVLGPTIPVSVPLESDGRTNNPNFLLKRSRLELNASCRPSPDQAGSISKAGSSVTRLEIPWATSIVQMSI